MLHEFKLLAQERQEKAKQLYKQEISENYGYLKLDHVIDLKNTKSKFSEQELVS